MSSISVCEYLPVRIKNYSGLLDKGIICLDMSKVFYLLSLKLGMGDELTDMGK